MPFCTKCGEVLVDGQRFCKKCGAPVGMEGPTPSTSIESVEKSELSDDKGLEQVAKVEEAPSPEKGMQMGEEVEAEEPAIPPQPSEPAADAGDSDDGPTHQPLVRRLRRRIAAIVAALLVVLVAAGSALYFSGALPPYPQFNQAESLSISRSVRLVPKAADGSTPLHYYVRVKRATDATGNEVDVSSAPVIEVTDGEGFNPDDVIAGLPDGTYTFEVETDEETFELPPIGLTESGEGGDGEAFEIGPSDEAPAPVEDSPETADEWFLRKIEGLRDTYGEPEVKVADAPDDHYDGYLAYPSGLSFAELIDFGDGVERLVVIYYGGDSRGAPKYSDYYLEVWEYDSETNKLVCVCGEGMTAPLSISPFDESAPSLSIGSSKDKTVISYSSFRDYSSIASYISLPDDGESTFLHSTETISGAVGSKVVRTYRVDGEEVSEEGLNEITSSINNNWEFETLRWYSLAAYYDSETEAQGGLKPSDAAEQNTGDYNYPGDMVRQVRDTMKVLQDRISGEKPIPDVGGSLEVAAREVTETVEVPTFYSGLEASDGTEQFTWGYLELTDGAADDVLSSVNEVLRKEYEDVKQETVNLKSLVTVAGECTSYRSLLTCNRDGLIGTYVAQYRTNWGPHGWSEVHGHIFDLASGRELEPWEVTGMSESELDDAAVEAIASYVMGNPGDVAYATKAEAQSAAREELEYGEYLLTNDGVVVSLPEYAMGYPYATGSLKIVVWAFEEPSLVGTNVADQFVIGS